MQVPPQELQLKTDTCGYLGLWTRRSKHEVHQAALPMLTKAPAWKHLPTNVHVLRERSILVTS